MRYLKLISYLITLTGLALVVAALALDLNQTVLLVGMMLIIAGLVKIAAVAIWHGVAGFGVPLATDDSSARAVPRSATAREEAQR